MSDEIRKLVSEGIGKVEIARRLGVLGEANPG